MIKGQDISQMHHGVNNLNPQFENLINPISILKHADELKQDNSQWAISAAELLNRNIEEIPCLLEPIFPKVGLCGFAGSSDTGKSSFLRQFATDVCLGEMEFLGFKLTAKHKRAIYVSTEDDENAIAYLLTKSNRKKQLTSDSFKGLFFVFETDNLIAKLDYQLSKNRVDLVVIDAFTDLYGKSMNDTNKVRTFLNKYGQLAQRYKCLIIFLHHTGKRTDDLIPSKHNLLGSQGFEAKMRLVIELRSDPGNLNKRHLCIVKANYLPKVFKTESYVLIFDDCLKFTITEERRPFEELRVSKKTEVRDLVKKMSRNGKTQIEIAKELNISQSKVSRLSRK